MREQKIRSLGEMGGDEHFDEQLELLEKIAEVIDVPDNLSEYLSYEIIYCCNAGQDYIPKGLKGFECTGNIGKMLRGEIPAKKGVIDITEQQHDDEFYKHAKKILRLTADQAYEFRETVDDYLEEKGLHSIKELFFTDDLLNEQAVLIERLGEKFNLNEDQTSSLNFEFCNRAKSSYNGDYKPRTYPYVADAALFKKILTARNYNYEIEDSDFIFGLYKLMNNEAKNKNYDSIFDIFNPENIFQISNAYNYIKQSQLSEDQKTDLILDLVEASKNYLEMEEELPKHPRNDEHYANVQSFMIADQIAETFGLSVKIMDPYNNDNVLQDIIKLYPEHVEGGENSDVKKVAFLIANKYDLPGGAEKTIEDIIHKVQSGGEKEADIYYSNTLFG